MSDLPAVGDVFTVRYPFVRRDAADAEIDEDYPWKPGTRSQTGPDDIWAEADALGTLELTVVSVHKPGKYPTRVFFTRQFIDPDGKRFGKQGCRIATLEKFRRLSTRFGYDYELAKKEPLPLASSTPERP